MTILNGKLPLIKFSDGGTYEGGLAGEWLNGEKHRHGIFTWTKR